MTVRDAALVVVAAGDGERLGADRPKALVEVAGVSMIRRVVATALQAGIASIVVVHHPAHHDDFEAALAGLTVAALVPGGVTRSASVRAGLAAALAAARRPAVVGVHDAARCLVTSALFAEVFAAVAGEVIAAAPGLPVSDTLKVADESGAVAGTQDRGGLWAVHTPQVIAATTWQAILAWGEGGEEATDDLALVERARDAGVLAGTIRLVRSEDAALKVTWPHDVEVAAAVLHHRERRGSDGEVA